MGPSALEEADRRQGAVLLEVLEKHPITLTLEELVRTQTIQRLGDEDAEATEHAITELRRVGLLHRNGDVIAPTLAAIRAEELMEMRIS
jgi:hypothetical protein